jgi:fermentation-respiration switch protein FrsA (DUF1100 family)
LRILVRILLVLFAIAVGLYLLVAAGLFVFQRKLLYAPDTRRPDMAHLGLASLRTVELETSDGLRLLAWYLPPPAGRPVIAYFHGNGGNLQYRDGRMTKFAAAGLGVLFLEYRGYGGNPGSPTEEGLYRDARAALDFLSAQGVDPARVALYGESLGTGVAVRMASEHPVGAVVLEAPYSSVADVAQQRYWFVPVRLLLKDPFDSMARIGAVRAPILVLLGALDVIVPVKFGRALFDAAPEPKELWLSPDAGHEDLPEFGGLDAAIAFIERAVSGRHD